ncbi:C40 family peptidase [Knoellia sinensis]|uniref:C40 family peptidase n=1 Tax=Knoellia sinensis TaxID=136100 RepID=UPI0012EC0047|nr:NlpC/P60 family protein [Knoellia sinensis]
MIVRRLVKILAWVMPLVLVVVGGLAIFASLLFAGGDGEEVAGGVCPGVQRPTVQAEADLDPEQIANAQSIVAVGRRLNVPDRGLAIAIATAMQESTLHNVPYGDRDSLGLFQQRTPWGSRAERLDPSTSAELFFNGGRGGQPGLLSIPNYLSLPLTLAAQAVQRSAFPDAYAKWEGLANKLLGQRAVAGARCLVGVAGGSSAVVDAALKWLGTPYSWGGGGLEGPTFGIAHGAGTQGFDCSGLTRYSVFAATGRVIPRVASDQARALQRVPTDQIQAGDLLFFHADGDPPGFYHHVGIADGNGGMVHAPRTGRTVEVVPNVLSSGYFAEQLALVGRAS